MIILKKLENGVDVSVNWYYDEDDKDMLEDRE